MVRLLAKMRDCFVAATQEASKLDEAIARNYSRLGSSTENSQVLQASFSQCGACHGSMDLKQTQGGTRQRKLLFFATCRDGWNLPRGNCQPKTENDNVTGSPVFCPICNYQVVRIMRGDGYEGNGYHVCPKCFSDPPVEHGGSQNGGEFRCFSCQHPTCSLASGVQGSGEEVFQCPFCGANDNGSICLRKNARGFILGCNKYGQNRCSYTIWLPKECEGVVVENADQQDENRNPLCQSCSTVGGPVKKITMTFRPGAVPPFVENPCTVCLLCDAAIRRDLEISLPRQDRVNVGPAGRRPAAARGGRAPQRAPARGRATAAARGRGGRGGRGTGRGRAPQNTNNIVCYKCNAPGHFANQCPNG